jgi:hypothetical protein
LEENRRKFGEPGKMFTYCCNFWKCVGYLFLFVFFRLVQQFIDKLEDLNPTIGVFHFLAFLPIFISYELFFIAAVIIGTIPFLIYPPLFRKLKFFIVYRLYQF